VLCLFDLECSVDVPERGEVFLQGSSFQDHQAVLVYSRHTKFPSYGLHRPACMKKHTYPQTVEVLNVLEVEYKTPDSGVQVTADDALEPVNVGIGKNRCADRENCCASLESFVNCHSGLSFCHRIDDVHSNTTKMIGEIVPILDEKLTSEYNNRVTIWRL